jgi:hypothetical protein
MTNRKKYNIWYSFVPKIYTTHKLKSSRTLFLWKFIGNNTMMDSILSIKHFLELLTKMKTIPECITILKTLAIIQENFKYRKYGVLLQNSTIDKNKK